VLDHPERELDDLHRWLHAVDNEERSARPIPFSLEDAFIGIVQRAEGA
jgi:ABC-2 type transport system ATP-binding protein